MGEFQSYQQCKGGQERAATKNNGDWDKGQQEDPNDDRSLGSRCVTMCVLRYHICDDSDKQQRLQQRRWQGDPNNGDEVKFYV